MTEQATSQKRDNHTPSCAVCQRRKVKCNREYPCAACTKSGLDCSFPPPRSAKRPRRNTTHQHATQDPGVHSRYAVQSYPERPASQRLTTVQRNNSVSNDLPSPESTQSNGSRSGSTNARLVIDGGGGYRYVNNHLYSALEDGEMLSPETSPVMGLAAGVYSARAIDEDNDHKRSQCLLFGAGYLGLPSPVDAPQMSTTHAVFLWQTYLANVDPVMKICHAPSVQQIFLGQIGSPNVPRNEKALIAAINFISVVSLTDEACQQSLQEPRTSLIQRLRALAELDLAAAEFMTTTDCMVLQALILYLAALRTLGDLQLVWSVLGMAIRVGGTIGLTRDGTSFNLSPFETEMRRRLWWGLVYFDGRMAEMQGQDGDLMGNDYETGHPSNLNDSDLFPSMTRLPDSRNGPTEAIYLQARTLSITVARKLQNITGPSGTWHRLRDANMSLSDKLDIMACIDQRYEDEILGPCDPSVPLQWLSINTARSFSTKLRLIARIPLVGPWESSEDGYSENEFLLSMDLMQLQVDLWTEPKVQQWRWHWKAHFQWYGLVCLLKQTRLRRPGAQTSRAWNLILKVFQVIIPTLELGHKKNLLLDKVNALFAAAQRRQEGGDVKPPHFGETNFNPLNGFSSGYGSRPHSALLPTPTSYHFEEAMPPPLEFDIDAVDWSEFDKLAAELCSR